MKEFVIDGNNFKNLDGFYNEIDRLLTKDLDFPTGHNYNAVNDLFRGGFGFFDYGTPITLKWKNYEKSKADLGEKTILTLIEIILDFNNSGHECKLELY